MIVIIDYKMGNVGSILNMLKKIGVEAAISAAPDAIRAADRLILPGVGAFDEGMKSLEGHGLIPVLEEKVVEGRTPMLGICLGMQLFADRSEEGARPGLGWIRGDVRRFSFQRTDLKIPHMGWNTVVPAKGDRILEGMGGDTRFYFVHSYHFVCADARDALLTAEYGQAFTAAVRRDNIVGVQFHPEKSHRFGMQLLKNFSEQ